MLEVKRFIFNPFYENTYIIWNSKSKTAAVIDPGCIDQKEEDEIVSFIESNSLSVKYLINTHCHIDHIFGNRFIKEKYNCEYFAPQKDVFMFDLMKKQAINYGMKLKELPKPDSFISENVELELGETKGKYLFTPGHSPGEYCIYFPSEKICITGDILFKEGIGRTDLWGGDYDELIKSIKEKLFKLPDDVKIFAGHGDSSTIGYEKAHNPFLNN